MSQYNNPYTNPQIQGVDFGVIAEAGQQAANNIAEASQSLIKQKAKAYEELQNDFADFTDESAIERLKGLDEEQNRAIRDSVKTNITDYSKMSQQERREALTKVGDIKAASESLEKMFEIANNPSYEISRGLDQKDIDFMKSIKSAKDLEFLPMKEEMGFILRDKNTGKEYSYSDINNMLPKYQDISPVVKGYTALYDKESKLINSAQKDFAKANQGSKYDSDAALLNSATSIYQQTNAKENALLYENKVNPFDKWNGSEEQKQEVINYNIKELKQRLQPSPNIAPDPRSASTSVTQRRQADTDEIYYNEAKQFRIDYLKAKDQNEPAYLEGYLPVGYFINVTPKTFEIYKMEVTETEGEFTSEGTDKKGKEISEKERKAKIIKEREPIRTIPHENDRFGYRTFSSISGKTFPFLQSRYMDSPRSALTQEEAAKELSGFKGSAANADPLNETDGVFDQSGTIGRGMLSPEMIQKAKGESNLNKRAAGL